MLGVSETVQGGDCALTVTGTINVAKADHAAIVAIFKILISHLLCVLGLAALRPLEHAQDRHRVDAKTHFELLCDFGQRAADPPFEPWRTPADCLHS